MEKLELKHLAPYLPYGLKIRVRLNRSSCGAGGKMYTDKNVELTYKNITKFEHGVYYNSIKPILRPLSDLQTDEKFTNEINENLFCGAWKFNFENECLSITTTEGYVELIYINYEIAYECSYSTYLFLVENHYDIFGLIDKKLAININTL